MDRQNRVGSKPGSGGVLSGAALQINERERLKRLAMQSIDLNKDPYFLRNYLGFFECKLCSTTHRSEGNYLAHTQCRRHQFNLNKRVIKERSEVPSKPVPSKIKKVVFKKSIKIGRPGYKVIKKRTENEQGLQFELIYKEMEKDQRPRFRIMSAFEQQIGPKDPKYQYLLFAGEPYETIGFRIPNRPLRKKALKTAWDQSTRTFSLNLLYESQEINNSSNAIY